VKLCTMLLGDTHNLMHKACGWMLREAGKRNRDVLRAFLEDFSGKMRHTMLRYSLEHFEAHEKG